MKCYLLAVILLLTLLRCKDSSLPQKQLITVSIAPEKYFVKQITGDDFEVNVLIPTGLSHVDYEPTPSNMMTLAHSLAYLRIGDLGIEQSIVEKISNINQHIRIYDISENIIFKNENHDVLKDDHSKYTDQHVWMSARNAKIIGQNIFKAVSEFNPKKKDFYQENLTKFCSLMDSLDEYAKQKLDTLSIRSFIIYHPSLTYYAKDYDLEQIAIEIDGKEPSALWMQHILNQIKNNNIRLLFVQREFSQAAADAIAEKTDIEIHKINPLSENWYIEFKRITDVISKKMK